MSRVTIHQLAAVTSSFSTGHYVTTALASTLQLLVPSRRYIAFAVSQPLTSGLRLRPCVRYTTPSIACSTNTAVSVTSLGGGGGAPRRSLYRHRKSPSAHSCRRNPASANTTLPIPLHMSDVTGQRLWRPLAVALPPPQFTVHFQITSRRCDVIAL